ncbi:MAG: hypothetical protein ACRDRQ_15845 [Pseudonocardiaceae bacterium]
MSAGRLTEADREEISRGVAGGLEGTVIAARIGWFAGVVSREITCHGGRAQYRVVVAQGAVAEQRRRPKGLQAGCLPAVAG